MKRLNIIKFNNHKILTCIFWYMCVSIFGNLKEHSKGANKDDEGLSQVPISFQMYFVTDRHVN